VNNDWLKHKNILITGITGFLGQNLAHKLTSIGAHVVGIVRDERQYFSSRGITVVRGSIEDHRLMKRIVDQYSIQICIHLAAQSIVSFAYTYPSETFETNIKGTWSVLDACRLGKHIEALLVASTDKVYGDQEVLPYTEDQDLSAIYPYDVSKVCEELLTTSFYKTYDVPVGITRCTNLFGPMDFNFSRIVPGTIMSILQGEAPVIRSTGKMLRDYMYVEDAVDGYIHLAKAVKDNEVCGEAFNFGTGHPITAIDLVEKIIQLSDTSLTCRVLGQESGYEIKDQFMDSKKAEQLIQWQPRYSLDQGLNKTIQWYRQWYNQGLVK
jgi:CDP-glucose 4,6-dehydratase